MQLAIAIYPCQTSEGYACGGSLSADNLGIFPYTQEKSVNVNNYEEPFSSYLGSSTGDRIFDDQYKSRFYRINKTIFHDDKSNWLKDNVTTDFFLPEVVNNTRSPSKGKDPSGITKVLHGRVIQRYPLWYAAIWTGNTVTEVSRSYMKLFTILGLVGGLTTFTSSLFYLIYGTYNVLMMHKYII